MLGEHGRPAVAEREPDRRREPRRLVPARAETAREPEDRVAQVTRVAGRPGGDPGRGLRGGGGAWGRLRGWAARSLSVARSRPACWSGSAWSWRRQTAGIAAGQCGDEQRTDDDDGHDEQHGERTGDDRRGAPAGRPDGAGRHRAGATGRRSPRRSAAIDTPAASAPPAAAWSIALSVATVGLAGSGAGRTTRARRPSRCRWDSGAPDRGRARERRSRRGRPARPGGRRAARRRGVDPDGRELEAVVSPLQARRPVSASNRTSPRLYVSDAGVVVAPLGLLGTEVVDRPSVVPGTAPSASAARRAIPKSVTIARPSRESRMLPGFTSRWTIPRTWATPSARATSRPIRAHVAGGQSSAAPQTRSEVLALDQLHDEIRLAVVRAGLQAGDDVPMAQDRCREGLAPEAHRDVGVLDDLAPKQPERRRLRRRSPRCFESWSLTHLSLGGLGRRDARDRHAERRAAHVVEPGGVEEADRVRVAAVLAADADLEAGPRGAAALDAPSARARRRPARRSSRTASARRCRRRCRAARSAPRCRRARSRAPVCVRSLVPNEKNSAWRGDLAGDEARARQLDHRADAEVVAVARSPPRPPTRRTSSRASSSSRA